MTEIEKTIEKIENVNLKKDDAVQILQFLISTIIKSLPIVLTTIKVEESLVRSRYLKDNEGFHHLIADYSYHPKPEDIKIGRANLEGQQIFYGSRFRITSLAEVRFIYANREKESARYSLGLWEVRERLTVAGIVTPELVKEHKSRELFELAEFIEKIESNPQMTRKLKVLLIYTGMWRENIQSLFKKVKNTSTK